MERTEKNWILEIILGAILVALVGLWGWTATRVIENGERIIEVKAELQREISEVKAELGREIAELNAKMDLLISGLNISVAPNESASAEPEAARGLRAGAGEQGKLATR